MTSYVWKIATNAPSATLSRRSGSGQGKETAITGPTPIEAVATGVTRRYNTSRVEWWSNDAYPCAPHHRARVGDVRRRERDKAVTTPLIPERRRSPRESTGPGVTGPDCRSGGDVVHR